MQLHKEMTINRRYQDLLREVLLNGDPVAARNHNTLSSITLPILIFDTFPLVTIRKTAWKMALREMEWFLSGETRCPDELLQWWDGQLDSDNHYLSGYGHQLLHFNQNINGLPDGFNQVKNFIEGINETPMSRRHIMTTWHPIEMANITLINDNPNSIATCHGTIVQGFVRRDTISLTVYQRSADLLLGVPHNWVQWWGFLLWAANQTELGVGSLRWVFGDAHLYLDQSHLDVVHDLLELPAPTEQVSLCYEPTTDNFKADDFQVMGDIPEPVTRLRPMRF